MGLPRLGPSEARDPRPSPMTQAGTLVRRHFGFLLLLVQLLVDLAVVLLACAAGYAFVLRLESSSRMPDVEVYRELWGLTCFVCLVVFAAFRMYRPVKSLLNVEEFKAIAKSTVVSFVVVVTLIVMLRPTTQEAEEGVYSFIVPLHDVVDLRMDPTAFSRLTLVMTFVLIGTFTAVSRFISFRVIQQLHKRGIGNRNVLILGTGEIGRWLQRKLVLVPTLGVRLVGFVSQDPDEVGRAMDRSKVLGSFDELSELISRHKVHEVFVALPESSEARLMELIERLEAYGVKYRVVPRFYHLMSQRVKIENLDSIPLVSRPDRKESLLAAAAKRVLDLIFSALVLILTLPVFGLAAWLIRRQSDGPVLFKQMRIGKDGQPFSMFKFRTMYVHLGGDAPTPRTRDDPRVTPIGRFLRRYSLDELPQFLNVLRGEMSVVGPRPEMPFIVEHYNAFDRERLRAKPGITGLWQISSNRRAEIHENLDYDIYYIENRSLLLDLVIIALTVVAVARGAGAH